MFRKLGFGSGKSKKRPKKKRLSPAAHERVGDEGASTGTVPPPSYQYAMNEYALTGPSVELRRPTTVANIDDEGQIRPSFSMTDVEEYEVEEQDQDQQDTPDDDANLQDETITTSNIRLHEQQQQREQHQHQQQSHNGTQLPPSPSPSAGQSQSRDGILRSTSYSSRRFISPKAEYFSYDEDDAATTAATFGRNNDDDDNGNSTRGPSRLRQSSGVPNRNQFRGNVEQMMPDATYEEWYGDAYVGGPIRYIYPSGYQSMRPRGGPWKLSILVCILFTWMSVFIIGYCSDVYKQEENNNNDYNAEAYDDDSPDTIDQKWCGSRLLSWIWWLSMLITGLASAYCGVIGYIKVRDFAVANTRSQPPGIMTVGDYSLSTYGESRANNKGNSDYYVPIGDAGGISRQHQSVSTSNFRLQQTHPAQYSKTIYQADGTPQFWGNQIYRPNQAAVHIVSR